MESTHNSSTAINGELQPSPSAVGAKRPRAEDEAHPSTANLPIYEGKPSEAGDDIVAIRSAKAARVSEEATSASVMEVGQDSSDGGAAVSISIPSAPASGIPSKSGTKEEVVGTGEIENSTELKPEPPSHSEKAEAIPSLGDASSMSIA